MISKMSESFIPITNEGTAVLHLIQFQVASSSVFFKGPNWPYKRVSIEPGKTYRLGICFFPKSEQQEIGKCKPGTTLIK
jgi:hypothetical protein